MIKKIAHLLILFFLFACQPAFASQNSCVIPNTGTLSGVQLVNDTNACADSLATNFLGGTAPSAAAAGWVWVDSTHSLLKMYDGSIWLTVGQYSGSQWQPFNNGAPLTGPTSTGSANAYIVTLTNAPAAYVTGTHYPFFANFQNSAAATENVNGLGAISLVKNGSTALASGDIKNGQFVDAVYDGVNMQTALGGSGGGGGSGTVTTFSVVTANGVSGSVANPTTTPAVTITLGAITPSSVTASGLGSFGTLAVGASSVTTGTVFDLGSNTNSMLLPIGTTGQRPTPTNGMIRYNSTVPQIEGYVGGAWTALGASVGGSGTVNNATAGQMAIYSSTGNAVSGDVNVTDASGVLSAFAFKPTSTSCSGSIFYLNATNTLGACANSVVSMIFNYVSSAVNYLASTPAVTGSPATLASAGSDSNIGIQLSPKGTGGVILNSTSALTLPAGTTGQRPTGVAGMLRYNSTIPAVERYINGLWQGAPSGQLAQGFGLGKTINCFGYSSCMFGSQSSIYDSFWTVPVEMYLNRGPITWAQRFLRGKVYWDIVNTGYTGGNYQGVTKYVIKNGGTGYSGSDTASWSGAACGRNPAPGALTVVAGVITAIAAPTTGSTGTAGYGCTGTPAVTITTAGGSGAVICPVYGGTGNYGVTGEQTPCAIGRISDAQNSGVSTFLMNDGANNILNGVSMASTEADLQTIWNGLTATGKFVYDQVEGPVDTSLGGSLFTAAQYKQLIQLGAWRAYTVLMTNSEQAGGASLLDTLDAVPEEVSSNANGKPNTGMVLTADGSHPAAGGALIQGWKLAQRIKQRLGIWDSGAAGNQMDVYDATNNPYGAVNPHPFMDSSGGTATTCTGPVANGWTLSINSGAGNASCVGSLEATRSDLFSGTKQVMTFSAGSAGAANLIYQFFQNNSLATLNLSVGQTIYGQCEVEIDNPQNMNDPQLGIYFLNGGAGIIGVDGDGSWGVGDPLPNTGTIGALDSSMPMTFRTPPMVIPAGTSTITFGFYPTFNASGGAASASGVVKVWNCTIRRLVGT